MIEQLKYNWKVVLICFAITMVFIIAVAVCVPMLIKHRVSKALTFKPPPTWDTDYEEVYVESEYDDIENWDNINPDTFAASDQFTSVTLSDMQTSMQTSVAKCETHGVLTADELALIAMSENDAWSYLTNGYITSYPSGPFSQYKSALYKIQSENTKTIKVKVWYWEDPSDDTNFNKISTTKTFAVNSKLAGLFEKAFEDIYLHPAKPIINLGDTGMGTWVIRGKNHNESRTMSSHSLGVTIDINPSTGSFCVNGKWYGNAYGQAKMPANVWQQLPECHKKYHVLYDGCPIVEIFKSYGFYWGGEWNSGTDCMHIGFIGDGSSARSIGLANYTARH